MTGNLVNRSVSNRINNWIPLSIFLNKSFQVFLVFMYANFSHQRFNSQALFFLWLALKVFAANWELRHNPWKYFHQLSSNQQWNHSRSLLRKLFFDVSPVPLRKFFLLIIYGQKNFSTVILKNICHCLIFWFVGDHCDLVLSIQFEFTMESLSLLFSKKISRYHSCFQSHIVPLLFMAATLLLRPLILLSSAQFESTMESLSLPSS